MPTYVMLANWTEQGMRSIGESPKRVDTAKKTLEEMGGQFRSVYMTMGMYSLIMIYDAPDDAVAARFTLMLGKLGNVRTTSLKAFPEEAYRQIVQTRCDDCWPSASMRACETTSRWRNSAGTGWRCTVRWCARFPHCGITCRTT